MTDDFCSQVADLLADAISFTYRRHELKAIWWGGW